MLVGSVFWSPKMSSNSLPCSELVYTWQRQDMVLGRMLFAQHGQHHLWVETIRMRHSSSIRKRPSTYGSTSCLPHLLGFQGWGLLHWCRTCICQKMHHPATSAINARFRLVLVDDELFFSLANHFEQIVCWKHHVLNSWQLNSHFTVRSPAVGARYDFTWYKHRLFSVLQKYHLSFAVHNSTDLMFPIRRYVQFHSYIHIFEKFVCISINIAVFWFDSIYSVSCLFHFWFVYVYICSHI